MIDIDTLDMETFRQLPLVRMGESKEIREHPEDNTKVIIWFRPTIYSFTTNRTGWVEGSNLIRARVTKKLVDLLRAAGVDHAYERVSLTTGFIEARRIFPHEDPNVETIVKCVNGGTSYHRYYRLDSHPTRMDHPFWPGLVVGKGDPFGGPKIRFDWRNPFWNPEKVAQLRQKYPNLPQEVYLWEPELRSVCMMRDEVLGEDFANDLLDVEAARRTALWTYAVLQQYMSTCNIVIYDLCLFITASGKTVYGEISPDCGRFRHLDHGMLDKDVWRSGGSSSSVLEKWSLLAEMIENQGSSSAPPS